jgi:hypothetical protein
MFGIELGFANRRVVGEWHKVREGLLPVFILLSLGKMAERTSITVVVEP